MEPEFVATIRGDIREAGGCLKKYLNGTGRSQCQVMDPNVDLAQVESRMLWSEDPIYPNAIGYDKMASGVKLVEGKIGARMGTSKRPRLETGLRREDQPRSGPSGHGQPAVDIRYLERPQTGSWSRTGPGARGGGGGQGLALRAFHRRRGGQF
jgi:hypothetical protein